jgi:hypothetical protein
MKIFKLLFFFGIILTLLPIEIFAQQRVTLRGTSQFRKVGVHRGNQVRTVFSNYGVIAQPGNEGPRGAWKYDANGYVGDVSPLVGLRLPIRDYTNDGIPDTIYSVIITPVDRPGGGESGGGKIYGFEPIPNFANPTLDEIGKGVAMNHQPETWPMQWPDYPEWSYSGPPIIINGVDVTPNVDWNGYFGRAQENADQESYFWMDDYNDEEFQQRYGFVPDSRIPGRTGHAIQVSVRGMQWSNFLAQDVIFWLYNITNDGTSIYDQAVFGTLVGTYVGVEDPEWNDDASFFNVRESITYTWDFNQYISPSANPRWLPDPYSVGYIAYAFLESPGNAFDGIDNDGDNINFSSVAPFFTEADFLPKTVRAGDKLVLISNDGEFTRSVITMPNDTITVYSMGTPFFLQPNVTRLVEGDINLITTEVNRNSRDGIDNDLDGIIDENYQIHYRQFKKARTTGTVLIDTLAPVQYKDYLGNVGINDPMIDEARDDGIDNDGDWNPEFDDVGADGMPGTMDFGEGDGIPTLGEPNFDRTDVDESDQIGLTSFEYFVPAGAITMANDADMWNRLTPGFFEVPTSIVNNVATRGEDGDFMYGAGYFPLLPGRTERFSLALAFGEDYPAVLKTKQTAQTIYNANYNFPRPPIKPNVYAVAGDKQVTLYWDKISEGSIDPSLKINDFEGYKIYKGTDPDFTDSFVLTNGRGEKRDYKPIIQFDLINEIAGYYQSSPKLIDLTDNLPFYLGSNTGIQNSWVDKDVINGKTYYYAVVGYDRGDASKDIFPTENTKFISKDALGRISTDINTVAVIPNAPVAGYIPPESGAYLDRISGKSSVIPLFEVIDPSRVKDSTYIVTFNDVDKRGVALAGSYNITNATTGTVLLSNAELTPQNADVIAGFRLSIDTSYQSPDSIKVMPALSGWSTDDPQNLKMVVSQFTSPTVNGIRRPNDYMLVFSDEYSDSSNKLIALFGNSAPPAKRVNFRAYDITDRDNPVRIQFILTEPLQFRRDTLSYLDQVTLSNETGTEITWKVVMTGDSSSRVPGTGDTLFITIIKPITSEDQFTFTTNRSAYSSNLAKDQLDRIRVVPNPYVVTNVFEQPLPQNVRGRGERVINFVNLPVSAKIHIYTSSGNHIRTIEHDGSFEDGSVSWDIRTKEGLDVAYGVYFYIVEVDGISEKKTGKIAIIK